MMRQAPPGLRSTSQDSVAKPRGPGRSGIGSLEHIRKILGRDPGQRGLSGIDVEDDLAAVRQPVHARRRRHAGRGIGDRPLAIRARRACRIAD